jgi:cytochrome c nitrite reductase small subunit
MFTLRLEPQVIRIKEAGRRVVHDNCIRCHTSLLEQHQMAAVNRSEYFANRTERECWSCHRETPHGTVSSLSSNRFARVPVLEDPVPEWLKSIMQQQSNQ